MTQTIEKSALARIYGHGRGWAFSPKDLQDLGDTRMALKRLADKNTIRRVIRGIYDYPKFSDLLEQQLAPDIHQVANALSRKFGWRIQPDGMSALNLIGISTQIPGQFLFLSDGPDRIYTVGKQTLQFKHNALKEMVFKNPEAGVLVQALKTLGQDRIDERAIQQMRKWLPENLRTKVLNDTERVTAWIYLALLRICGE